MLYFNFLYTPDGGGYQNSLSFVRSLLNVGYSFEGIKLIVIKESELHDTCIRENIMHIAVARGAMNKMFFELQARLMLKEKDVVFSIFGPPMLNTSNHTLNIGGMAISNVFYPNIDFWAHLSGVKKRIKKWKDSYRMYRYSKLDHWIFETDLLMRKAIEDFGFPEDRCNVIKMAPSILVQPKHVRNLKNYAPLKKAENCFLFLCGAHPNKRLHVLPKLASYLKEFISFQFVMTAESNHYLEKVLKRAEGLNVLDCFTNVGPVKPENVATIIDCCDYVCTFSLLESFSNNFVEAWAMKKPLIVTDDEWSREACRRAAFYIKFENLKMTASRIAEFTRSKESQLSLLNNGLGMLDLHPTPEEKALQYIEIINKATAHGKRYYHS